MNQIRLNSLAVKTLAIIGVSACLFSFSSPMGIDSFEIYINKQLVLKQYVSKGEVTKSLELNQRNLNDQVDIYYTECRKKGKGRTIAIKDDQNRVLKEWRFGDETNSRSPMSFRVRDIVSLQKAGDKFRLNLFYTSHELPEGRLLAFVTLGKESKTRP